MKKMKLIAFVMIAAIAMVGAGYAAWGTVITDNTTLKTGNWSIVLENDAPGDSLVAEDEVYSFDKTSTGFNETALLDKDGYNEYDAVNSKVNGSTWVYTIAPSIIGDTVNFAFYNMHPGTKAITRFEMRNLGSIPAKVANVTVKLNNGSALNTEQDEFADAITVSGTLVDHIGSGAFNTLGTIPAGTTLSGLESALETILNGKELSPEKSIGFRSGSELEVEGLAFTLPANALTGNKGMNANLPISIDFDFAQYNQN
ncbi:MAG: hypothetical protein ACM3UU_06215 [Ignavibacteriales bacterium]